MKFPRSAFAATILAASLCGCAAANDADVAKAVEPSLRMAALTAEASNDYKGAAQHWQTLYQHHPEDKGIALSLARALRYGGSPAQGADVMQASLVRFGRDADVLTELGKDYLADQRIPLALKYLDEARTLAPTRWDIPSAIGVSLDSQRRFADAAAAYAQALTLSPDNPEILNNLGLSQALSGKLDDGIATLRHANDQPAADAQVRQNLAMLLALKGDAEDAEALAHHDLPPDLARANSQIFHDLAKAVGHPGPPADGG